MNTEHVVVNDEEVEVEAEADAWVDRSQHTPANDKL